MTNAERFIGDEDLIDTFIDEFNEFACKQDWDLDYHDLPLRLKEFFKQQVKPQLTEDEKVILRNIKIHDRSKVYSLKITRDCDNGLWLKVEGKSNKIKRLGIFIDINSSISIDQYSHLFKFIKDRRRI